MEQLSRRITPLALFMLSLNGIIGSGWLFTPFYAAKIAGPAAVISWIIGGAAITLVAFTFAEVSTMLPVAGGTARIPHLSHGTLISFTLGWIAWVTSLMLAPIEVQAVLQYAAWFFPALVSQQGTGSLSAYGYFWAAVLMLALCLFNILSYRGLMRFNFIIFIVKFSVILVTIVAIFSVRFTPVNFTGMGASMMTADGWKMIFHAVAAGGIVFAFNGFKSGVELAGEAKNPSFSIPLGTAGAVLASLLIYLGLQLCFIGALSPGLITSGWANLSFSGDIGPFVGLAAGLGLAWLLSLLYVNAVISPLGAGLIYVTSTARILYALSKIGYAPKFLSRLNKQHFPVYAILVNFSLGMLSFLPLPGWQSMVSFLISAMVITYAMGPIALVSLRMTMPHKERPFRLPAANILCLIAFYSCNLFSYWTGWETISKLAIILGLGLTVFMLGIVRRQFKINYKEFKSGMWIIPYLSGLILFSYLGAYGGKNIVPFGWDFVLLGIFSLAIFYLAIRSRLAFTSEAEIDLALMETVL